MLKRMLEERNKEEGFTLIELLVVIIIIGILAAIAIPVFLQQRQRGWDAAVESDLRNMATAQETVLTSSDAYTATASALESPGGFKFSDESNYTLADGEDVTDAITIIVPSLAAEAGKGYCMYAQSASGNWFSYGSASGLTSDHGETAPTWVTDANTGAEVGNCTV